MSNVALASSLAASAERNRGAALKARMEKRPPTLMAMREKIGGSVCAAPPRPLDEHEQVQQQQHRHQQKRALEHHHQEGAERKWNVLQQLQRRVRQTDVGVDLVL